MTEARQKNSYVMSFTAAAMLSLESVRIAKRYEQAHDWSIIRQEGLNENLLQAKSRRTSERLFGEIIARLKTLTVDQLELLTHGSEEDQRHLLWLAICKRYEFIRNFAIEVVRERYLQLGAPLTRSDYESFFTAKAAWHSELEDFGKPTRDKLRQNLFKMIREAGLLSDDGHVIGAFLSPALVRAIVEDSVEHLMIFPVHETDVERWAKQ